MAENKKPSIRFKGFTDAWEQRKLDTITDVRDGTHDSPQYVETGNPFITSKNVKDGFINYEDIQYVSDKDYEEINKRSKVDKNDILMGMIGTIGNIALVRETPDFAIKNVALIKDIGDVYYRYLYHCLQSNSVAHQLDENLDGGTQKFIALNKIRELVIPVPSEHEQHKIGDYMESLDNLITLHQRKYEKLKNVKKSMLEKMFPKNGSNVPEIRFKGFTDDWEQRKVGEFTNVQSASRVHKNEWVANGVPFYRSSDVVSAFKGNDNEKAFISTELYEELIKSSGKLEKDDILITGGGSIGIPYIVPNNEPLYSKDADLIWVKKSKEHDSEYLYTYFASHHFREYIGSISHVGTIAHYTIEQVKDTPVQLPTIAEQRAIGTFFHHLDNLITLHQRELEKLQNIKKSLLEKMFV